MHDLNNQPIECSISENPSIEEQQLYALCHLESLRKHIDVVQKEVSKHSLLGGATLRSIKEQLNWVDKLIKEGDKDGTLYRP